MTETELEAVLERIENIGNSLAGKDNQIINYLEKIINILQNKQS